MEEFFAKDFGAIKLISFVCIFLLIAGLQVLAPYRRSAGVVANWKRNLPLAFLNSVVMGLLCASCVCSWSLYIKNQGLGAFNAVSLPLWFSIPFGVVILDATAYAWHRANHGWTILWRFHSVHHSDDVFEASTALRFHLGELLVSLGIRFVIVAAFGISIASILIFEIVFQLFNIFEHGNIRLGKSFERILGAVFITPALHRKHHSLIRTDLNSNFGTILSLWDRLFATFHNAQSDEDIRVGLPGVRDLPLKAMLFMPFRLKTRDKLTH